MGDYSLGIQKEILISLTVIQTVDFINCKHGSHAHKTWLF